MRKTMHTLLCLLAGAAFTFPCAAEDKTPPGTTPQTKTMLALYKVKFGKIPEFNAAFQRAFTPMLDQLVTDGTLLGYGLESDVLHTPNEPNTAAWFTAASYANLQKAEDATWATLATHPAEAKILLESCDMDAHQDLLLESVYAKFGPIPAGAKPFTSVALFKVKPGKEADFNKAGEKFYTPFYNKLIEDGVIYGYHVETQSLHGQDPGNTWVLIVAPDMAAFDKLDAAFEAKMKSMTPAERSMMDNEGMSLSDIGAHRDHLTRSVVFRIK